MTLDGTDTNCEEARRLKFRVYGGLRCVLLACALVLFAALLAPSKAQAHVIHAETVLAEAGAKTGAASDRTAGSAECETMCCAPATCASALALTAQGQNSSADATRYGRPADERAGAFPQAALKRPPRV